MAARLTASTASSRGVSHSRRGTLRCGPAGSSALRVGGFSSQNSTPEATIPAPTAQRVVRGEAAVASATASAGPTMNDSSTDIESSAYAGRRRSAGTSAATDCRTTENTGRASSPARNAAGSRTG